MSEPLVLDGARAVGSAEVREVPGPGMVTLKADLGAPATASAVREATGSAMPGVRQILGAGDARVAWMAPDEVLLIVARADVGAVLAGLDTALAGSHHLAADVSDMRALFAVEGAGAREVLAKLCPVDLAPGEFEPGEFRRTRLAQVPAEFWMEGEGFRLVCFRSVAGYAFDVLKGAARPGFEVAYF